MATAFSQQTDCSSQPYGLPPCGAGVRGTLNFHRTAVTNVSGTQGNANISTFTNAFCNFNICGGDEASQMSIPMAEDAPGEAREGPSQLQPSQSINTQSLRQTLLFSQYNRSQSQRSQSQQLQRSQSQRMPGLPCELTVNISRRDTPSQELMCTPDYNTPVEQQFIADYDVNTQQDQQCQSKSPAQSPKRHIKRPRRQAGLENMDEDASQASQSSGRYAGEPSTSSKTTSGLPPLHRGNPKSRLSRPRSPTSFKNPYIPGSAAGTNLKHAIDSVDRQYPVSTRLSGDFKSIKEIGSGAFSKVFQVRGRVDGMDYALKRTKHPVQADEDKNRWLKEVQAMVAMRAHPNIVQYYSAWAEADVQGDYLYIQMELAQESLAQVLSVCRQAWPENMLVDLLRQMASALVHIHARNMVHLDIKPDNIYKSEGGLYKLGDFGLATLKDGSAGFTDGDARYLAPELLNNDKTDTVPPLDKADVFSLGCTLYELATGKELQKGGPTYQSIRHGQLPLLPAMSGRFQSLIKSMLDVNPAKRPSPEAILKTPVVAKGSLPLTSTSKDPRRTSV